MRNRDSQSDTEVLQPRKPIESAREMGLYVLAACFVPFSFLAMPATDFLPDPADRFAALLEIAPRIGVAALDSMSWSLGAYITALLAVYAVYFGTGLASMTVEREMQTRRTLGTAAVAATSLLIPLSVLMAWGAISEDPSKLGTLFAAAPLLALTFVLTIELGNFIVMTRSEKIAAAEHALTEARARQETLPKHASKPAWLVVLANAVCAVALLFVLLCAIQALHPQAAPLTPATAWNLLGISAVITLPILGGGLMWSQTRYLDVGRVLRTLSLGIFISASVAMCLLVLAFVPKTPWQAVAMLLVMAVQLASAIGPMRRGVDIWAGWSLFGAGVRQASRVFAHQEAAALKTLTENGTPRASSLKSRFAEAVRVLRGPDVPA